MNDTGKIFIDRKILNWEWYQDLNTKSLFIHLMLTANWKPSRFMGVEIQRGERAASIRTLSEETGISERSVRTALNHLKSTGELTIKRHSKFSVVTLINYSRYQTADKQAVNQVTSERQATDNNRINIKKKEVKKYNNTLGQNEAENNLFNSFWEAYPKKVAKQAAEKAWKKLNPDKELTEAIISALSVQKNSPQWTKDNGQYIPHPATWLNGRRWEDAPEPQENTSEDYSYGVQGVDYL